PSDAPAGSWHDVEQGRHRSIAKTIDRARGCHGIVDRRERRRHRSLRLSRRHGPQRAGWRGSIPRRLSRDKRVRLADVAIAKACAPGIWQARAIDTAGHTHLTAYSPKVGRSGQRADARCQRVRIEWLDALGGNAPPGDEDAGRRGKRAPSVRDPFLMTIEH